MRVHHIGQGSIGWEAGGPSAGAGIEDFVPHAPVFEENGEGIIAAEAADIAWFDAAWGWVGQGCGSCLVNDGDGEECVPACQRPVAAQRSMSKEHGDYEQDR